MFSLILHQGADSGEVGVTANCVNRISKRQWRSELTKVFFKNCISFYFFNLLNSMSSWPHRTWVIRRAEEHPFKSTWLPTAPASWLHYSDYINIFTNSTVQNKTKVQEKGLLLKTKGSHDQKRIEGSKDLGENMEVCFLFRLLPFFFWKEPAWGKESDLCIIWLPSFAKWTKESVCGGDFLKEDKHPEGCNQWERNELGRVRWWTPKKPGSMGHLERSKKCQRWETRGWGRPRSPTAPSWLHQKGNIGPLEVRMGIMPKRSLGDHSSQGFWNFLP